MATLVWCAEPPAGLLVSDEEAEEERGQRLACVCSSVCACIHSFIISVCTVFMRLCMCVHEGMYMCMCVRVCVSRRVCVCAYACVHECLCMCVEAEAGGTPENWTQCRHQHDSLNTCPASQGTISH